MMEERPMLTRKRQRGQAMAEYFVAGGVVLAALLVPIKINGKTDTAINLVLESMKSELAGFMYAIQPPQPKT